MKKISVILCSVLFVFLSRENGITAPMVYSFSFENITVNVNGVNHDSYKISFWFYGDSDNTYWIGDYSYTGTVTGYAYIGEVPINPNGTPVQIPLLPNSIPLGSTIVDSDIDMMGFHASSSTFELNGCRKSYLPFINFGIEQGPIPIFSWDFGGIWIRTDTIQVDVFGFGTGFGSGRGGFGFGSGGSGFGGVGFGSSCGFLCGLSFISLRHLGSRNLISIL